MRTTTGRTTAADLPRAGTRPFRRFAVVLIGLLLAAASLGAWWSRERIAQFLHARRTAEILSDAVRANAYRTVEPRLSQELPYKPFAGLRGARTRPVPAAALSLIAAANEEPAPESLHAAGVTALLAGRWNEAVLLLERASAPERADVLSDLATAYYERGRDRHSVPDLTLAFEMSARAIGLDPALVAAWSVRALVLEELALREDAAEAWEAYLARDAASPWAAEAHARLRKLSETAQATPRQARTFVEENLLGAWGDAALRGNAEVSKKTLAEAKTAAKIVAAEHADRTALDAIALIEREVSPHRLAVAHAAYRDARRLMERARDAQARDALRSAARQLAAARSPLAHRATIYAATITHYLGANDEAEEVLTGVLDDLRGREHEHPVAVGQALWIRALIAVARRRPHDALELAASARRTLEPTHEPSSLAGIDTVLADVHRYLGNADEAWQHRLLAFRALDRNAPYMRRQILLAETSRAAMHAGHFALARALTRRIAIHAAQERDTVFTARALLGEAEILRASPEPDEAEASILLDRAWLALNSRPVTGSTIRYLADIAIARAELRLRRDPAAAAELLENAVAQLGALDHHSRFARIQLLLGRAHVAAGDAAGAERAYLQGIEDFESERATVPFDQQRSVFADTARPLYEAAVQLLLARGAEADALAVVRRARGAAAQSRSSGADVRIEYFVLPGELVVWTTAGGTTRMYRTPLAAERLTALIERHLDAIHNSATARFEDTAARLFDVLLAPSAQLAPANARIVVAPDAVLHRVPFASLYNRTSRRFVAELFSLTIALGGGARANNERYRSVLVVMAPEASGDLPVLPHVKGEVENVARSFATRAVLDGSNATKGRFLADVGDYQVVHFAGHAVANELQPAFGALRLAPTRERPDGALYAYEIESRSFPRTRLVVLSACDTAAGRLSGSGALSFARAFTAAGVAHVIGSLWRVEDRATAKTFALFYASLRTGAAPAEALRAAQRAALASQDRNDPAAWAAFQLYASDLD